MLSSIIDISILRNLPSPSSKARNMDRANVSRRKSIIAECFGILKPSMYDLSDVSQICMNNIGIFCWVAKSRDTTFLGCKKEVYFRKWRLWKAKTSVRFASTCCTVYYTEAWRKVTLHCYNSFTIMCNSKNSFVSMQALHCRISACRLPINLSQ